MATRPFSAPRALATGFDRLWRELASWSPRATAIWLWRFLAPAGLTTRQRFWRLLWLPFWIWSDFPAPVFRSYPDLLSDHTAAGDRLLTVLRRLARRHAVLHAIGIFFRAITLSSFAGGVWAVVDLAGGPHVDSLRLTLIALVTLAAATVLAVLARPRPHDVARMLDRSFALNDRITTGLEQVIGGAASGRPRGIDRLQIVDATNTIVALAPRQPIRVLLPVREAVLAIAVILILAALLLMRGTGAGLPPLRDVAVPSFVSARDRIAQEANFPGADEQAVAEAPSVEEVQEQADASAAAEQDLLALADALDDNSLTKPIADAIRAGDYDLAAAEVAEVASELSTLSPEARQELADKLDKAAESMSGENPELEESVENTADSLRTGEDTTEPATDLSEEVQKAGEKIVPREELASDMTEARTSDLERGQDGSSTEAQPQGGEEGEPSNGQPAEEAPGEGQDASGGQGSQDESAQSQSGQGESDESSLGGQQGSESDSSADPTGEEPGEGSESMGGGESTSSESTSGEGGQTQESGGQAEGGQPLPEQGPTDGTNQNAQDGAGSGGGEGENSGDKPQSSNSAESRPGTGGAGAPDPIMTESEATTSTTDQTEVDPSTSITLSRSPEESGYQAGGTSGSSSSGSGQGAAAGTGSIEQNEVGVAGPDANRVPAEYRSTVEEYFSGNP